MGVCVSSLQLPPCVTVCISRSHHPAHLSQLHSNTATHIQHTFTFIQSFTVRTVALNCVVVPPTVHSSSFAMLSTLRCAAARSHANPLATLTRLSHTLTVTYPATTFTALTAKHSAGKRH